MKQQIKNIMRNIIIAVVITLSLNCFSQTIEKEFGEFSQLKTFDGLSVELVASDTNRAVISGEYKEDVIFVNKNSVGTIKYILSIQDVMCTNIYSDVCNNWLWLVVINKNKITNQERHR